MVIVLVILSFVLIYWVTKLSSRISDLEKTAQYNLDAQNKQLQDIENTLKLDIEQREHLLGRIHDLEQELNKI